MHLVLNCSVKAARRGPLEAVILNRMCTHMLALEGEGHVEWFEGNFEHHEADKIRRLGPVEPKRIRYKKFAR
jgi:hypothetical protein